MAAARPMPPPRRTPRTRATPARPPPAPAEGAPCPEIRARRPVSSWSPSCSPRSVDEVAEELLDARRGAERQVTERLTGAIQAEVRRDHVADELNDFDSEL